MKIQFIKGKPVTTTYFQSMKPLGINGKLVLEDWKFIYAFLKQAIGSEAAALFLEPVLDRQRGEVDWYIPSDMQYSDQGRVSREATVEKALHLIEQIRQLAITLTNASDFSQKQKGELLLQALNYPDENSIIATPYGPALVAWGHESTMVVSNKNHVLAAKGQEKAAQPFMPILSSPVSRRRKQWFLKSLLPWFCAFLILGIMLALPWWSGLIPVDYCRYHWVAPIGLVLMLLPVIGMLIRHHRAVSRGQSSL